MLCSTGQANRKKNSLEGFTLVELIVVLVILAILAAIMVPSLLGYIDKAKNHKIILHGRQAYLAAQTLASENYAAEIWEEPEEVVVLELATLTGEIVSMTFTQKGIVDATEDHPFRYRENGVTAKYANRIWTIEDGAEDIENGSGEIGEEPTEDDKNSDDSVTLTDSTGQTHTIRLFLEWSEVQERILKGWNIQTGCVLSDGTGTYLYNSWSDAYIQSANAKNWTMQDLMNNRQGCFIKLDNTNKIWVSADSQDGKWNGSPKKGDLCYYGGKYYVAPGEIGLWTFPAGGWIHVPQ